MLSKSGSAEKEMYASNVTKETNHVRSLKLDVAVNNMKAVETNAVYLKTPAVTGTGSETAEYAVQVGVYKTSNVPKALIPLMPVNTEQTAKGFFRFVSQIGRAHV